MRVVHMAKVELIGINSMEKLNRAQQLDPLLRGN